MAKPNGYIIFKGPSELDGAPIIVIATGFAKGSSNLKTGAMIQTWILRADILPIDAVKSSMDASVCGHCPLRPVNFAKRTDKRPGDKACYVNVGYAPGNIWKAYHRGIYPQVPIGAFLGRIVRADREGEGAF